MKIADRNIGLTSRYVIAEVGVNHEGSLDKALAMIDGAANAGAHGVKFQAYKAGRLASRESPSYWDLSKEPATSQYELFSRYDGFGEAEYMACAQRCGERGIHFLATAFDQDMVESLSPLMPAFKVASADITNVLLLRRIAEKKKPVLLSVGAASLEEIEAALRELAGCEVALLHCVLNYPCAPISANLRRIQRLQTHFPSHVVGYSDHVVPDEAMTTLVAALGAGALVLEKHFTLDRNLPGNDHYHAMDADDLKRLMGQVALIEELFLRDESGWLPEEALARQHARRSLVAARDIEAGEAITSDMLIPKRPAHGIPADQVDRVTQMRAKHALAKDTVLAWGMLEDPSG